MPSASAYRLKIVYYKELKYGRKFNKERLFNKFYQLHKHKYAYDRFAKNYRFTGDKYHEKSDSHRKRSRISKDKLVGIL